MKSMHRVPTQTDTTYFIGCQAFINDQKLLLSSEAYLKPTIKKIIMEVVYSKNFHTADAKKYVSQFMSIYLHVSTQASSMKIHIEEFYHNLLTTSNFNYNLRFRYNLKTYLINILLNAHISKNICNRSFRK
jgi:hypothetical protein